ncbi:GNAT family N-acetyltransferase [Halosegnis sp.]|uniref:GNAT family N-acetyltransferase n=1 Tax=Halosegnis sp. TaxID=2864959 RepID=UPI0035D4AE04
MTDIERATAADVDALVDLWVQLAASQRAHGSHLSPADNRAHIRESLSRRLVTGGVSLARLPESADDWEAHPEGVVGFVSFHPETGVYEQDTNRGVIENLYVVPERRGEGIGSNLLAAAEDALAEAGAEAVTLDAMAANERARQFYRRHGYEPHRVEFERRLQRETDTNTDRG